MTLSLNNLRSGFERYTHEGLTVDLSSSIVVTIFVSGFTSVVVSLATASRFVFDEYGRLKV